MLDEAMLDRLFQAFDCRCAPGEAPYFKELEVELGRAPSPAEVEMVHARLDARFDEDDAEEDDR